MNDEEAKKSQETANEEALNKDTNKKTAKVAAKGAATYFAPGVGAAAVDLAAKTPQGDKILEKGGEVIDKVTDKSPTLKKGLNKLNESGALDAADQGLSMVGGSPSGAAGTGAGTASAGASGAAGAAKNAGAIGARSKPITNGESSAPSAGSKMTPRTSNGDMAKRLKDANENIPDMSSDSDDSEDESEDTSESFSDDNIFDDEDISSDSNKDETEDSKKEQKGYGFEKKAMDFVIKNPWVLGVVAGVFFILLLMFIILNGSGDGSNKSGGNGCTSVANGDLLSYVNGWEGNEGTCTTNDGLEGYKSANLGDGTITAGYGVTNHLLSYTSTKEFIEQNNWGKYFEGNSPYTMVANACYPKSVLDQIKTYGLEAEYSSTIDKYATQYGVELTQYQRDAITSFNYNLGAGHTDELISAYASGGYEGLWNVMKKYMHSQGKELSGLKKRRKGEFALFVTGDYTDQGLFYSRSDSSISGSNYDNYDSEGVMARKGQYISSNNSASVTCSDDSVSDNLTGVVTLSNGSRKGNIEVVNIAKSEIGYTEGSNNNTKFGQWYGLNYNPWCAMFVSWVMNQVNHPEIHYAGCDEGMNYFKKNGQFAARGYTNLVAGDVVFFGKPSDSTHTGIVTGIDENKVYTIEGNTSNQVRAKAYDINDTYIVGFGLMNF